MPPKAFVTGRKAPMTMDDYNAMNARPVSYSTPQKSAANNKASPASSGFNTPLMTPSSSTTSLTSLNNALSNISLSPISDLVEEVMQAQAIGDIRAIATKIADVLYDAGAQSIQEYNLLESLVALSKAKGSSLIREGALLILSTVARKFGPVTPANAYLAEYLSFPLDLLTDKDSTVKRAAQQCTDTLYSLYPSEGKITIVLTTLLNYLSSSAKWQSKMGALKLVEKITVDCENDSIEFRFLSALPVLTNVMHDVKPELSKAGHKCLTDFAQVLDNLDISSRIPLLIETLSDPRNVTNCIKILSTVTFVAEVTEPALALLVPILQRALSQSSTSQDQLRQTVIVVENLTRLVHDPREIKPFISILKPGIKRVVETAALPEVRELATKALKVLEDAEAEEADQKQRRVDSSQVREYLATKVNAPTVLFNYIVELITMDANTNDWKLIPEVIKNYLGQDQAELANTTAQHFKELLTDQIVEANSDDGIEIVNTQFSLAYGGRMLLNKTILRLIKGHRYGLCGRNGCGKSTLMRAIANGQLEGFPDQSELRTCFVEHKLQGEEGDLSLVDFIAADPDLQHVSKNEIGDALESVGFNEERRSQNVSALSGGWKMKLELARAMLMKADILLLDEPTNHLDVANVRWLEEYLVAHTDITSLIVSHDSGFLDAVCTDIIHYETKKLAYYKGNLADFVKVKPEGKAYYTLTDSNVKMAFPPPGILSGVKSNTRSIARLSNVTFSYPGAAKPSLSNVSISLCLSSRVAVLGPNGAGKSTLIKLLTGELVPTEGKVEKHPNLRIGYIAQHALQHVELHKEKTANQYLQWRYKFGDDREVHLKQSRKMSDEEKAQMLVPIDVKDGQGERIVEAIVGRQKLKKSFQYEIKWKHFLPKFNSWISREDLIKYGFNKLVQEFDDHEASREGLGYRDLSPPVIRKHFEGVGLDGDIADHTPLGSLSGGQLVKVVIAGAMWNNPHLLVLDEPTNYLDRDSLGGLAIAIRDWTGGVVMISHNNEFTGALCPEQWQVENGMVVSKGISAVASASFEDNVESDTSNTDADSAPVSGASTPRGGKPSKPKADDNDSPANIKVRQRKKKLTRNEIKERDVRRRARYMAWIQSPKGTPRFPDTDDEEE
ncbi:ATP binding cassette family member [Nadsonia fulvescens var. elongata DSM 6958]|uniref:ATP binding cassette family member n=1 Tax=Nadsonia fulvescens var. elongata DSM 6958 TaxID=857566 RepID=A0A1E3PEC9_9ASCO|nr:ATP binding cassette family member [Nadsonia fulvescens var. elongata DSM 6958]